MRSQINNYLFNLACDAQAPYNFHGAFGAHAAKMFACGILNKDEAELFANKDIVTQKVMNKRYVKIQYRRHNNQLQIWAMNEGIAALEKVIVHPESIKNFEINGQQHLPIQVLNIKKHEYQIQFSEKKEFVYEVKDAMLLSDNNLEKYRSLPDFVERVGMLQNIVKNQIVDFINAINANNGIPILCSIEEIRNISSDKIFTRDAGKKIAKVEKSFHIVFSSNVCLPDKIAIGRHKAYGKGIIERRMNSEE